MAKATTGIVRAKELYENRDHRAKELKSQGRKIIGYVCAFVPLEFITAADLIPYRITANANEPITEADTCLETVQCAYSRSLVDLGLKGVYNFLDGIVFPQSCCTIARLYGVWKYYLRPTYSHFLCIPYTLHRPACYKFFEAELTFLKESIERFAGLHISHERLRQAIHLHNENRALARELYGLRKQNPPLLSGSEMTQIMVAAMTIPIEESNELLSDAIEEVKQRQGRPEKRAARVLIYGCPIDDVNLIQLTEESGANVVIDDLCVGTRFYWHDVEITDDLLDGIATRYLEKVMCPRTMRESPGERQVDLDNRFGYLKEFVKDFEVNGVILSVIRYCDSHEFDAPDARDYLREMGVPVLHLEHDYSTLAIAPLRTRIEAFLEMIG